jgi:TolA-binding protein
MVDDINTTFASELKLKQAQLSDLQTQLRDMSKQLSSLRQQNQALKVASLRLPDVSEKIKRLEEALNAELAKTLEGRRGRSGSAGGSSSGQTEEGQGDGGGAAAAAAARMDEKDKAEITVPELPHFDLSVDASADPTVLQSRIKTLHAYIEYKKAEELHLAKVVAEKKGSSLEETLCKKIIAAW